LLVALLVTLYYPAGRDFVGIAKNVHL